MDQTNEDRTGGRRAGRVAGRRQRMSAVLALVCVAAPACATGLDKMRSETEIPEFREVALREIGRTETIVLVDTADEGEPPVRIAVELRGRGDADHIVVAVHGVLSDSRVWRFVAWRLEADHDLMLVDLPGCGRSDKPDPDELGPAAYSTTSMARRVLLALRHCLALRGGDDSVTLMAHSLGGAVALRMLGDANLRSEFADVVERIESVVLMSPLDVRVERQYETFKQIVEISDLEVAVGRLIEMLHAQVVMDTIGGVVDSRRAIREEAERMIDVLCDPERRHAAQAMLRRAVPFLENGRPDWAAIELLEGDYANIDAPCLLICGGRDESLPCSMAYKIRAQLPDARLRVLPLAMHSLPTERPWTCASLVRRFIESRGKGWQAVLELKEEDGRAGHPPSREDVTATEGHP